jgi:hypothetical protein
MLSRVPIIALCVLLGFAITSRGEAVKASIPFGPTSNFDKTISLEAPDPAKGALKSVDIEIDGAMKSELSWENKGTQKASDFAIAVASVLTLLKPGTSVSSEGAASAVNATIDPKDVMLALNLAELKDNLTAGPINLHTTDTAKRVSERALRLRCAAVAVARCAAVRAARSRTNLCLLRTFCLVAADVSACSLDLVPCCAGVVCSGRAGSVLWSEEGRQGQVPAGRRRSRHRHLG